MAPQAFSAPQFITIPKHTDLHSLRNERKKVFEVSVDGYAIFGINSYYPVVQNGQCIAFAEVLSSTWNGNFKDTRITFRVIGNAKNLCAAYNVILSYIYGSGKAAYAAPEDRYENASQQFIPGAITGEQYRASEETSKPRRSSRSSFSDYDDEESSVPDWIKDFM